MAGASVKEAEVHRPEVEVVLWVGSPPNCLMRKQYGLIECKHTQPVEVVEPAMCPIGSVR